MISYWNHAPGYETCSLSYVGGDCLLAPHLLLYMADEAFSNFVFLILCYSLKGMYQYLIIVFIEVIACIIYDSKQFKTVLSPKWYSIYGTLQ